MPVTGSIEREIKLAAPERFRLPDLGGLAPGRVVTPEEVVRQTAVYYDTAELHLTRWDCGLRHRTSDGWTLKLGDTGRGDAVERREFRLAGSPSRPPAAALDLVQAFTRGRSLEPRVRLRTLRRRVRVHDGAGEILVEVTNDHVTVLDGPCEGKRFREVEVEFAGVCPPQWVEEILARLRNAGTGPVHRVAKHVRALGLEAGIAPEVPVPGVGPESTVLEAVRFELARSVDLLVRADPGVRADEDAEDVHQMRVATRRLRSHLRSFRRVLDDGWSKDLTAELRELGSALGGVRDADVLGERLRRGIATLPEAERRAAKELLERLADDRRLHRERLLEHLRSESHAALVERLIEAAREPRLPRDARAPAAVMLAPPLRRRWRRLRREVERLRDRSPLEGLHRVRIASKHARYAAEALAPVLGRRVRRFGRSMRRLQQTLGEYQDSVVTGAWLRDAAANVGPDAAFSAGLLAARERKLGRRALRAWKPAWKRARRSRPRPSAGGA